MSAVRTVDPTDTTHTLQEVKAHIRVDDSVEEDDALIVGLLRSSIEWAETFLQRALLTQTWVLRLDRFPAVITPPRPPLQSVTSIQYVDDAGQLQTLDAAKYQVDIHAAPPRIVPAFAQTWPTTQDVLNAVTVTFVAGYGGRSDVPESIRHGILMLVGHLYEHRESVIVGAPVASVPMATESLLWPYRLPPF